jgi:hypothetical protein
MSISIISVLKGIGTGHLPTQSRSVTSCASPLDSKCLLMINNMVVTTNNSRASWRKIKQKSMFTGESIRGHGPSQSMGVLSRVSIYFDFICYGHKQLWNPKTDITTVLTHSNNLKHICQKNHHLKASQMHTMVIRKVLSTLSHAN